MEWQAIETAPKDCSNYLIWFPNGEVWGVNWDDATWDWWPSGLLDAKNCSTQNRIEHNEPTHWMPLPAPPTPVDAAPSEMEPR